MAGEDRYWLWVPFCLVGGMCAWSWYWYIRSIIFYCKNGFDFSEDFGPKISEFDDDDRFTAKPKEKFLIAWPVFVVVSTANLIPITLLLLGILKPGYN
ncbi:hypothetical protein Rleg4DRAFT_3500 [Rhizobium leguminosarum bv. trifolii WSM2297]|uniref:Transmembrane protein n=1 Tax=Rhizobium leguminosarum bv. trifolii WSM2297 TaxID=754762 RepID=J0W7S0_RHILT|nr:hypothetical protein [Rhizobium leguminosarum]EJC81811.1 hypothetical protein Rleg4DRAFT_3500 [Rhizobium leguminosarum bv. trifolii WSM2297]